MAVTDAEEPIYDFEGYTLYVGQRRLFRGDVEITLTDATVRVLIFLIERRERLVEYDELYSHMWGTRAVFHNNMSMHVTRLRKIMGSHVIITLAGRGFQFVSKVTLRPGSLMVPIKPQITLERAISPFIAQSVVLNDVVVLLDRHRLVLVTGPFGVGKSRVANEIGSQELFRRSEGPCREPDPP